MKLCEVCKRTAARRLSSSPLDTDYEIQAAFASDLMSDALHMIGDHSGETLLITGLCNPQILKTAEMLDVHTILLVRGKQPQADFEALLKTTNITVLGTDLTMYEACGRLYEGGLKGLQ